MDEGVGPYMPVQDLHLSTTQGNIVEKQNLHNSTLWETQENIVKNQDLHNSTTLETQENIMEEENKQKGRNGFRIYFACFY